MRDNGVEREEEAGKGKRSSMQERGSSDVATSRKFQCRKGGLPKDVKACKTAASLQRGETTAQRRVCRTDFYLLCVPLPPRAVPIVGRESVEANGDRRST